MNAPKPHAPMKTVETSKPNRRKTAVQVAEPEAKKPFKLDEHLYGKPLAEHEGLLKLMKDLDK